MTDPDLAALDKAVIEAAEKWANLHSPVSSQALYNVVLARQRALRPSRVDVIADRLTLMPPGLTDVAKAERIDQAITEWEREQ